jgi:hypothetical protein
MVFGIGIDLGAGDLQGGHIADPRRVGRLALPPRNKKPVKLARILKPAECRRRTGFNECAGMLLPAASQQFERPGQYCGDLFHALGV